MEVLGFNPKNIKNYTSPDEYAEDLINREMAAIFLEIPVAKLFLARYCKGFTTAGPVYKVGGFGFVSLFSTSFFLLNIIYFPLGHYNNYYIP